MSRCSYFTSESVSQGHPDKIADQVSDAILDAVLSRDPEGRVAVETLVKTGMVIIAGEMRTNTWVDIEEVTRKTIRDIGYTCPQMGFDAESCAVMSAIGKQSADIAQGVDSSSKTTQGAGDQGLMFGYATNETATLLPAPIFYAHKLMKKQAELRKKYDWIYPDAKSQVTYIYQDNVPVRVDTIVLSTQHAAHVKQSLIEEVVMEEMIKPCFPQNTLSAKTKFYINPTGRFVIGGPVGDCGLTGRKIIVDTYGGMARHGGGCFSGKDPSKVDRSAAYMARYVAKNVVAVGLAKRCEIQLSYAIGIAEPISIRVDTFGTHRIAEEQIEKFIMDHFNFTPHGIIETLNLLQQQYLPTAAYGHFGRDDIMFPWEEVDQSFRRKCAESAENHLEESC